MLTGQMIFSDLRCFRRTAPQVIGTRRVGRGAKQWPAALSLLLAMRQTALRPDDVAFNTAGDRGGWGTGISVCLAHGVPGFRIAGCNLQ